MHPPPNLRHDSGGTHNNHNNTSSNERQGDDDVSASCTADARRSDGRWLLHLARTRHVCLLHREPGGLAVVWGQMGVGFDLRVLLAYYCRYMPAVPRIDERLANYCARCTSLAAADAPRPHLCLACQLARRALAARGARQRRPGPPGGSDVPMSPNRPMAVVASPCLTSCT